MSKSMVKRKFHQNKYKGFTMRCKPLVSIGSLGFTDDVTADKSRRMNSKVHRAILSAYIQLIASNPIGHRFTVQMDNDTKHASKTTQKLLRRRRGIICKRQSPDLNPTERAFHLLKAKHSKN